MILWAIVDLYGVPGTSGHYVKHVVHGVGHVSVWEKSASIMPISKMMKLRLIAIGL